MWIHVSCKTSVHLLHACSMPKIWDNLSHVSSFLVAANNLLKKKYVQAMAVLCFWLATVAFFVQNTMFQDYEPSNSFVMFQMLSPFQDAYTSMRMQEIKLSPDFLLGRNKQKKVLICTMLSEDFGRYSIGAQKLANAIHKDLPSIQGELNVLLELGVLEIAERPIPSKVWNDLKKSGWQKKITRARIPPRTEGAAIQARFRDQLSKLHLWSMDKDGFDWVIYLDSDMFVLRSLLPLFYDVLGSEHLAGTKGKGRNIWAIPDFPAFPDAFNMGLFAIQPDSNVFQELQCMLHASNLPVCQNILPVQYAEEWMEQGFLNAVFMNSNWTKLALTHGMNLAIWTDARAVWYANATSIQIIHFTMVKPWSWWCAWTHWGEFCYLFWHKEDLSFHTVQNKINS